MRLRRLLAAGLACAAIGAAASSCTAVIGGLGDDDNTDVVTTMCKCQDLAFLGTASQCREYLVGRFDGMTAEERQDFLEVYAAECKTCDTVKKCFYRAPICRDFGCRADGECCSFATGGGCNDDGTCS